MEDLELQRAILASFQRCERRPSEGAPKTTRGTLAKAGILQCSRQSIRDRRPTGWISTVAKTGEFRRRGGEVFAVGCCCLSWPEALRGNVVARLTLRAEAGGFGIGLGGESRGKYSTLLRGDVETQQWVLESRSATIARAVDVHLVVRRRLEVAIRLEDGELVVTVDSRRVMAAQRVEGNGFLSLQGRQHDKFWASNCRMERAKRRPNPRHEQIEQSRIANVSTTFEDIVGLEEAKLCLNESIVLPAVVPELFVGARRPWRGVLLFGPPGTGKSMLARAAAGAAKVAFYAPSAATLIDKWRGESEKLLRELFAPHKDKIIFFDEIDSLATERGGPNEHEASRRFKTELLTHMDGIYSSLESPRVLVLAATNRPWDLDDALLRRLERRVYVPPPCERARAAIIARVLAEVDHHLLPEDIQSIATSHAENFSAADVATACRQAAMMPVRRLLTEKNLMDPAATVAKDARFILQDAKLDHLTVHDLRHAFTNTHPSISQPHLRRHLAWAATFAERKHHEKSP